MWRQVVYTHGASTGRCCAHQAQNNRRRLGANIIITRLSARHQQEGIRPLSSAQPSSWEDSSPFTMSLDPSLKQVPTSERVVMKTFLNTLQLNSVSVETRVEEDMEDMEHEQSTNDSAAEYTRPENSALQVIQTEISSALVAVSSVVSAPLESDS